MMPSPPVYPMPTSPFKTELSRGEISYRQWGQGLPVLCLHGLGDSSTVWQSLGDTLSHQSLCVALDLPGHGDSFKPQSPKAYSATELVSTVSEFIELQQWRDLSIIAHSWSAKLALIFARENPLLVKQLILVDPFFVNRFPSFLKPTLPLLYRTLPFLKMIGPFATMQAAETTARSLKQYRGWSQLQQEVFQTTIEPKDNGQWGSKFAIAARDGVFLDTFEQSGLTTTIQTPTHLLLPEDGLNRSDWQLKPYIKYLPQLTIQSISGNHWPHLVSPIEFNRKILETLNPLL